MVHIITFSTKLAGPSALLPKSGWMDVVFRGMNDTMVWTPRSSQLECARACAKESEREELKPHRDIRAESTRQREKTQGRGMQDRTWNALNSQHPGCLRGGIFETRLGTPEIERSRFHKGSSSREIHCTANTKPIGAAIGRLAPSGRLNGPPGSKSTARLLTANPGSADPPSRARACGARAGRWTGALPAARPTPWWCRARHAWWSRPPSRRR